MSLRPILAKGNDENFVSSNVFLAQHLQDVFVAAGRVVEASGSHQLSAMGLKDDDWQSRFRNTVLLAAAIHDIGKANRHFQEMIYGGAARQPIRHEWISVWLAEQPVMKEWLLPVVDKCSRCWHVAMAAIAGHHPKRGRRSPQASCFKSEPVEVLTEHKDFRACLKQIQRQFDLVEPPEKVEAIVHGGAKDHERPQIFESMVGSLDSLIKREIQSDPLWRRFCACVKACVVASDVAGSALWEQIDSVSGRESWILDTLSRRPASSQLESIVSNRIGNLPPREFQEGIGNSAADVTLVEAGCGSGKTVAAYMWAARQHPGRRLWFCYPTTGTASSGFLNYLLETQANQPEHKSVVDGADLFHSRTHYDKLQMLGTVDDEGNLDDSSIRVESLKAWDTKIVACTVDSLLMIMQNQRRGLYAWPAIAQSAVVFDEVHSYDDELFGNLLTFLCELPGIPALVMTASLPKSRRSAIERTVKRSKRTYQLINGPDDLETLPRYHNHEGDTSITREDALELTREEFDAGGRVLWISNTVERTRKVGLDLADCGSRVYHSRFIYKDRIDRHNDVTAFFDSAEAGCAATSQVAEMSLDLKYATLLITELAPIPALIQRLGRLNRAIYPEQPQGERTPKRFVVIEPRRDDFDEISALPYEDDDLELARVWLANLGTRVLSQSQLVEAWREVDPDGKVRPSKSCWLTSAIETLVDAIREPSFGITVIREADVANAKADGSIVEYTLPMNYPQMKNWALSFRYGGFPVASESSINYCSKTGATWSTFEIC